MITHVSVVQFVLNTRTIVRFQVLTAASRKMRAFWDTASIITQMKEAVYTSETSVYSKGTQSVISQKAVVFRRTILAQSVPIGFTVRGIKCFGDLDQIPLI
jgi:hypothetical protein